MLYSSGEQNILGGASFSAPVNREFILHNNAPSKHWEISTFIIYALSGNPTYLLGFILPSRSKLRNLIFLFSWMDAIFCPCLMWIVESIETKARFALEGSCWCMPPKAQDSFSFTYHILRYILYLTSFFQLPIHKLWLRSIQRICICAPMLKSLTIHHFLMFSLGPIPLSKDQNMETKPQKKWISQVIWQ